MRTVHPLFPAPPPTPGAFPAPAPARLEEVAALSGRDMAAALVFAVRFSPPPDGRPVAFVASRAWLNERGRPFGWAFRPGGDLVLAAADRETEALWAAEEMLRSGAFGAALIAAERPSLTATRRLDHAARTGGARGVVLRGAPPDDLSAAWRRWRIASAPSAANPEDPKAPGGFRLSAALTRNREGPPGSWILEWDDAADRFRLAEGLGDHGLGQGARTVAAA